jgi:hypothetical protein
METDFFMQKNGRADGRADRWTKKRTGGWIDEKQTFRQTDMIKLIVSSNNLVNAPNKKSGKRRLA